MTDCTSSNLKKIKERMDSWPLVTPQPGDTAQLVDENEPDGDVIIKRADGTPVLTMSRATWDELRGEK